LPTQAVFRIAWKQNATTFAIDPLDRCRSASMDVGQDDEQSVMLLTAVDKGGLAGGEGG